MGTDGAGDSGPSVDRRQQASAEVKAWMLAATLLVAVGCARLPYTTQVVHQDARVVVQIQREVEPVSYSHPVQLSAQAIKAILGGFSVREKKKLPLRWFAEELPPHQLFREDELTLLAPHLASALEKVGRNERVTFEVRAPGFNPANAKETTSGWIAVHEPFWHLSIDYFRVLLPISEIDQYYYRYPNVPPPPRHYLLTFEPSRFWVENPQGGLALNYRAYLKSPEVPLTP